MIVHFTMYMMLYFKFTYKSKKKTGTRFNKQRDIVELRGRHSIGSPQIKSALKRKVT